MNPSLPFTLITIADKIYAGVSINKKLKIERYKNSFRVYNRIAKVSSKPSFLKKVDKRFEPNREVLRRHRNGDALVEKD
jgi:hypothetical protein